jgi:hypothetical protein
MRSGMPLMKSDDLGLMRSMFLEFPNAVVLDISAMVEHNFVIGGS